METRVGDVRLGEVVEERVAAPAEDRRLADGVDGTHLARTLREVDRRRHARASRRVHRDEVHRVPRAGLDAAAVVRARDLVELDVPLAELAQRGDEQLVLDRAARHIARAVAAGNLHGRQLAADVVERRARIDLRLVNVVRILRRPPDAEVLRDLSRDRHDAAEVRVLHPVLRENRRVEPEHEREVRARGMSREEYLLRVAAELLGVVRRPPDRARRVVPDVLDLRLAEEAVVGAHDDERRRSLEEGLGHRRAVARLQSATVEPNEHRRARCAGTRPRHRDDVLRRGTVAEVVLIQHGRAEREDRQAVAGAADEVAARVAREAVAHLGRHVDLRRGDLEGPLPDQFGRRPDGHAVRADEHEDARRDRAVAVDDEPLAEVLRLDDRGAAAAERARDARTGREALLAVRDAERLARQAPADLLLVREVDVRVVADVHRADDAAVLLGAVLVLRLAQVREARVVRLHRLPEVVRQALLGRLLLERADLRDKERHLRRAEDIAPGRDKRPSETRVAVRLVAVRAALEPERARERHPVERGNHRVVEAGRQRVVALRLEGDLTWHRRLAERLRIREEEDALLPLGLAVLRLRAARAVLEADARADAERATVREAAHDDLVPPWRLDRERVVARPLPRVLMAERRHRRADLLAVEVGDVRVIHEVHVEDEVVLLLARLHVESEAVFGDAGLQEGRHRAPVALRPRTRLNPLLERLEERPHPGEERFPVARRALVLEIVTPRLGEAVQLRSVARRPERTLGNPRLDARAAPGGVDEPDRDVRMALAELKAEEVADGRERLHRLGRRRPAPLRALRQAVDRTDVQRVRHLHEAEHRIVRRGGNLLSVGQAVVVAAAPDRHLHVALPRAHPHVARVDLVHRQLLAGRRLDREDVRTARLERRQRHRPASVLADRPLRDMPVERRLHRRAGLALAAHNEGAAPLEDHPRADPRVRAERGVRDGKREVSRQLGRERDGRAAHVPAAVLEADVAAVVEEDVVRADDLLARRFADVEVDVAEEDIGDVVLGPHDHLRRLRAVKDDVLKAQVADEPDGARLERIADANLERMHLARDAAVPEDDALELERLALLGRQRLEAVPARRLKVVGIEVRQTHRDALPAVRADDVVEEDVPDGVVRRPAEAAERRARRAANRVTHRDALARGELRRQQLLVGADCERVVGREHAALLDEDIARGRDVEAIAVRVLGIRVKRHAPRGHAVAAEDPRIPARRVEDREVLEPHVRAAHEEEATPRDVAVVRPPVALVLRTPRPERLARAVDDALARDGDVRHAARVDERALVEPRRAVPRPEVRRRELGILLPVRSALQDGAFLEVQLDVRLEVERVAGVGFVRPGDDDLAAALRGRVVNRLLQGLRHGTVLRQVRGKDGSCRHENRSDQCCHQSVSPLLFKRPLSQRPTKRIISS